MDWSFFIGVVIAGLLAGVMYSLVAIGFVLIYKTSGVFNFAQGAMVLFAALTFVSLHEEGVPFWGAFAITLAAMIVLGILIEKLVLRPLINQPPITLFMATLGLSYIIQGAAQMLWGTQVHQLDLGIADVPLPLNNILISQFDVFCAVVAGGVGAEYRATAALYLGGGVECGRLHRFGGRITLGCPDRRAVFALTGGAEILAGAGGRRL
jgi:branched-chain amino acid transport system permease protein